MASATKVVPPTPTAASRAVSLTSAALTNRVLGCRACRACATSDDPPFPLPAEENSFALCEEEPSEAEEGASVALSIPAPLAPMYVALAKSPPTMPLDPPS